MSETTSEDFYHGVIACLAVIKMHDNHVIFAEILRSLDEKELLRVARKNGDMRWSGLGKYMREQKQGYNW